MSAEKEGEKKMKRPYFHIGVPERVLPGTGSFLFKLKDEFRRRLNDAKSDAAMQGREMFHKTLASLRETLREIFEQEEALMIRTRYPDLELQHASHKAFRGQLRESQALEYHPGLPDHLLHFMDTWLYQHEILSDIHFFRYLAEWEKLHPPRVSGTAEAHNPLLELHPELALLPVKFIRS